MSVRDNQAADLSKTVDTAAPVIRVGDAYVGNSMAFQSVVGFLTRSNNPTILAVAILAIVSGMALRIK